MRGEAKSIDCHDRPGFGGRKVSIMLGRCKLPYAVRPVNIGIGDPFKRSELKIAANNRMPAIVDPDGPGGKPISNFESGVSLNISAAGRKNSVLPVCHRGLRPTNGCSGRWLGLVRLRAKPIILSGVPSAT